MRVLIVDSDRALAASWKAALLRVGHEVTCVTSAEEALSLGEHEVLLAEVDLPGMDGLELLEALHLLGQHPRAIIVSACANLETCQQALRLGADDFLAKPVEMQTILDAVEGSPSTWAPTPAVFERTYPACRGTDERAARELAAYCLRCYVAPATRARIATTCAELVGNVIQHAYPGTPGEVQIEATVDRSDLTLRVSDSGIGFDPLCTSLDHLVDCLSGGLARAAALSEDVRIDAAPGEGTRVEARFSVTRSLFDDEATVDLSDLDWMPPEVAREVLAACDEDPDGASRFVLSPALAVSLGRLLAGPDPRHVLRTALWS